MHVHIITLVQISVFVHIKKYSGTPEVAGLTPVQAVEIVRGCRGLNLIGADVVEVIMNIEQECIFCKHMYMQRY